jgi:dynein light intermediate chain 1
VEAVNNGWSLDIEETSNSILSNGHANGAASSIEGGAVGIYEETIRDPSLDALQATAYESNGNKLEVSSVDPQIFLAGQLEILDKIRQDTSGTDSNRLARGRNSQEGDESRVDEGRVNEHIGPVQFNMGGIQVDADDMLQRLRVNTIYHVCTSITNNVQERQSYQTPEPTTPGQVASPDGKSQNEALASFFAGLMKRGGGSAANSPKPAS